MKQRLTIQIIVVILIVLVPIALISTYLHTTHAHAMQTISYADWPEFRANASRNGSQSSDTLLSNANANSLVPVSGSAYTTGGEAMSSPAAYQGIVYYSANTTTSSGSRTSTIYAVNVSSGQLLWSKPFPPCGKNSDYSLSSPAVTTGLVNGVATTEVFSGWGYGKGCMYDFDGLTGNLIWNFALPSAANSSVGIMSTSNGNIAVVGDNSTSLHAFSVDFNGTVGGKGVQLWSYSDLNDPPPPASAKYCQKAGQSCGDSIWSSPAEGLVMVNGTLHHYIYFGVGASSNRAGRLDAIDLDSIVQGSPKLAWAFWDPNPGLDNDFASVTVNTDANNFATRVFTGMHTGHMFALDAVTGQMYFDFSTSAHISNVQSFIHSTAALVTINGTTELIFGSGCNPSRAYAACRGGNNGYVWAIDALSTASGGTLLWQSANFGGDIVSSPAVANQDANAVVYIMGPWYPNATSHGDLLAFNPANGTLLADYPVFNHAYGSVSSPAIYGSHIFVTEGYSIYTFPPPAGGGLAAFQCAGCP